MQNPAKLIIHIEGGCIRQVLSDRPMEIYILDEDPGAIDDSDCDEIELYQLEGPRPYYVIAGFSGKVDTDRVDKVIQQIEQIHNTGD